MSSLALEPSISVKRCAFVARFLGVEPSVVTDAPDCDDAVATCTTDCDTDLDAATAEVAALAPGYETLDWRALQPVIARILELADAQLVFMLLVVYVAVGMVVLNAMLMSVFERIHEFGVMKAIGVTPWQITALVFMETLVQVSAAGLLALGLGWWSARYFQLNGIDLSGIASAASIAPKMISRSTSFSLETASTTIRISLLMLFLPNFSQTVAPGVPNLYHPEESGTPPRPC